MKLSALAGSKATRSWQAVTKHGRRVRKLRRGGQCVCTATDLGSRRRPQPAVAQRHQLQRLGKARPGASAVCVV